MNDEENLLSLLMTLWPVFVIIVGAIVWLMLQLNSKMNKEDCKDCRDSCENRQNMAIGRVEATLVDMRHEFCGRLDTITSMVMKLDSKNKEL